MANDIGGNPWIIDTASATALLESRVWIERVIWDEPSSTTDEAIITDAAGNKIWGYEALAAGAGISYTQDIGISSKGLIVPTLGSGTLYIYIK